MTTDYVVSFRSKTKANMKNQNTDSNALLNLTLFDIDGYNHPQIILQKQV